MTIIHDICHFINYQSNHNLWLNKSAVSIYTFQYKYLIIDVVEISSNINKTLTKTINFGMQVIEIAK